MVSRVPPNRRLPKLEAWLFRSRASYPDVGKRVSFRKHTARDRAASTSVSDRAASLDGGRGVGGSGRPGTPSHQPAEDAKRQENQLQDGPGEQDRQDGEDGQCGVEHGRYRCRTRCRGRMMTIRNRLRPERGEMVDGTVVPRGRLSRIPRPRRVARADACAFAHAPASGRAHPQHGPDGAPVVADGHAPVRAQAPPQPASQQVRHRAAQGS